MLEKNNKDFSKILKSEESEKENSKEFEQYIDLSNSEHYSLLLELIKSIENEKVNKILDAGSGKTSLSILLKLFPDSNIDAIVYYNDSRKINSIKECVISNRYNLNEKDICKDNIDGQYDLVLAHLLLGEAKKWGNAVFDLFCKLININSKYLIIYDYKEDESIDYKYLEQVFENKFIIVEKKEIEKKTPQVFENFIGKTYIAYLLRKKDTKILNEESEHQLNLINDIQFIKLETKRLLLRKTKIGDTKILWNKIFNNYEDYKFYKYDKIKNYVNFEQKILEQIKKYDYNDYYKWNIVLKEANELIGSINLHHYDKVNNNVKIGYFIFSDYRNKGYATEAINKVIDFAFNILNVNKIIAGTIADNDFSNKVLLKTGFVLKKTNEQDHKIDGKLYDQNIFELLKDDKLY